ncbi:MAG: transcription elongation factor GreA [Anaerolineae bacterium]|jgi:transcription elongation factor GreA|nr:transcription elongation factor GreA [Anaerolineae bacterium]
MANTFLTQEGFDKLQEELNYLRKDKRQEVADRLREASDGEDLIENAEYEAAKNEQAFVEGRIKELEILLATAKIIEDKGDSDSIQVGSTVTIQEVGSDDKETFTIVGAAEAQPSEGRISNESPLGRALLNHRKGEEVVVKAPDGDYQVKIVKVS